MNYPNKAISSPDEMQKHLNALAHQGFFSMIVKRRPADPLDPQPIFASSQTSAELGMRYDGCVRVICFRLCFPGFWYGMSKTSVLGMPLINRLNVNSPINAIN